MTFAPYHPESVQILKHNRHVFRYSLMETVSQDLGAPFEGVFHPTPLTLASNALPAATMSVVQVFVSVELILAIRCQSWARGHFLSRYILTDPVVQMLMVVVMALTIISRVGFLMW